MASLPANLIWGDLLDTDPPVARLVLRVVLCRLRPALISKGRVGKHHRAVARNGRVLLASALALDELEGQEVTLRVAPWHRRVLPGDAPRPEGVLLCAWPGRPAPAVRDAQALHRAVVAGAADPAGVLHIDLGGLRVLSLVLVTPGADAGA
jgi:hypothetical protein